ncbi:glycoside hydrolase family protein [Bradyrhizobium sp.]|jgi:GH24 family phage-related lysozyme (muramidase)|uniref:glycoside hydrolase family protein n=1 Tax=Bradyrhizobium sp. TaxID=376 RepID=UPI002DDCCD73|nr:glycoside hydrolase family protein [Bradyrhizobium sp.]HEV2155417.1 glycoside hydrolase family protein [Bradyrhizobium sp.]
MSARKTAITVASASAIAMATVGVKHWEGFAPTVVPDKLANGLPTGGYGETEDVKLGETHSEKFWSDRLAKRLVEEYDVGIGKCIKVDLPDGVRASAISLAYNAGVGAVCSSSIVKKWNAGDIEGGCRQILTKDADGRYTGWRVGSHPKGPKGPFVIQRGLVNRRADEQKKCLAAAREPKPAPVVRPAPAPAVVAATQSAPKCFLPWIFKCKGAT